MQVQGTEDIEYKWDQTGGTNIDSSYILTPLDLSYICFAPYAFSQGNDYQFTLNASYGSQTAKATVDFIVNLPPNWGYFFSDKISGVEFVDVFTFSASDWKDPEETDYPLKYAYRYTDSLGQEVDLRKATTESTFKTKLTRLSDNNMNLILEVFDSLEASSKQYKTVQVTMDAATRAATINAIIESLATSQLDERASLINSIPTDFPLTDDQYEKILDSIADWVSKNNDDSSLVTTTAISIFQHITKFEQAKENASLMLNAAKSISQIANEGLSREQAT